MIRYLSNDEIDFEKWDDCITHSVNGLIYGYSWYLDSVCSNWDALVLDDYEAVFPIPYNSKLGIRYALQPLFCQQLGIFAREMPDLTLTEDFLDKIPNRFRLLRLHLNHMNRPPLTAAKRTNHLLELILPYKQLVASYSKNCLRNIERAKSSTCQLIQGMNTHEIIKLYRESVGLKSPLKEKEYNVLGNLIDSCISKGAAETVAVYSPVNHLCAAGVFLKDGKRIYYLLGAADKMGREYMASFMILDYVIHKYSGRDLILDFEGSEIKGIARFFKGFGAQESYYWRYERNLLPWPVNRIANF